jgi:ATP-dependent helicase HrpB
VVLATAIAETSLTVEGVRIVVDAGRARRSRFDPGSGMSRLVTERATRAEAAQRRGRAGRTAPGLCLRLWTAGEEGALAPFAPPEMLTADLAGLALALAVQGARGAEGLRFLDPPPAAAFAEARTLLRDLGALDAAGAVTARGRAMAALPLHPRLARMVIDAGEDAAAARALAAILSERDPLRAPGAAPPADLGLRLEAVADADRFARERGHAAAAAALARVRETLKRLGGGGRIDPAAAGRLAALAYPDRIGGRRPGPAPRFLLSGGKGAATAEGDPLGDAALIVAADLDGDPREARVRLGAPIARAEVEGLFADRIAARRAVAWDARARAVTAVFERRLGALALEARPLADATADEIAAASADGVRRLGLRALPWTDAARRLVARVEWARAAGAAGLPDWSEAGLLASLDDWLAPHLGAARRMEDWARLDLAAILRQALGPAAGRALDAAAPEALETPAGARRPIDYGRAAPTAQARPQELYGLDRHPTAAGRPILLELVSPAGRPIAATADLPGFWRGAWADARRDMRGRYPKHDWPERPWEAQPSARPKPRR